LHPPLQPVALSILHAVVSSVRHVTPFASIFFDELPMLSSVPVASGRVPTRHSAAARVPLMHHSSPRRPDSDRPAISSMSASASAAFGARDYQRALTVAHRLIDVGARIENGLLSLPIARAHRKQITVKPVGGAV